MVKSRLLVFYTALSPDRSAARVSSIDGEVATPLLRTSWMFEVLKVAPIAWTSDTEKSKYTVI